MLYREIIAVYSEIHTKHINTLCGQNVESLNVQPGGWYSNHCALKFKLMVSTAERAAHKIHTIKHCQTAHPLYHYFNKPWHPIDNPKTASAFPLKVHRPVQHHNSPCCSTNTQAVSPPPLIIKLTPAPLAACWWPMGNLVTLSMLVSAYFFESIIKRSNLIYGRYTWLHFYMYLFIYIFDSIKITKITNYLFHHAMSTPGYRILSLGLVCETCIGKNV